VTDAEYKKQKARILGLARSWVKPLGLDSWDIVYVLQRAGIKSEGPTVGKGRCILFEVDVDWRYLKVALSADMLEVAELSDDELEAAFVHELMHIFVNEMRADRKGSVDHEERVCQTLALGILSFRRYIIDLTKKELARKRPIKKKR
jgi:hypothetical protein